MENNRLCSIFCACFMNSELNGERAPSESCIKCTDKLVTFFVVVFSLEILPQSHFFVIDELQEIFYYFVVLILLVLALSMNDVESVLKLKEKMRFWKAFESSDKWINWNKFSNFPSSWTLINLEIKKTRLKNLKKYDQTSVFNIFYLIKKQSNFCQHQ